VPIWYEYLAIFLSFQEYLEGLEKNERRKIQVNSTHFALVAGRLYRRGIDGILQSYVSYDEVPTILEACHGGECGGHFSRQLMAQKYYGLDIFSQSYLQTRRPTPRGAMHATDMHVMTCN